MLCYRCGTHSPDTAEKCPTCGQNLTTGGQRNATGTFSRRRPSANSLEGAPYKPQDLVAERYLIKDIAGAGPLGFVFRAHDKEVDVEVALKVLNPKLLQSPEERKQFGKQLRLARKLSHPNIVRVYEEGEDAERPYFTSQFLDGLTLRKIIDLRLQKGQFFSLGEIEPILSQICAALDGAHKVGPHSDLKPENVLVLPDLLKITDFGLALALPRLPFVQAMKARKADRYLAPELVGGSEIDGRADIYSVGVILGEMLSGLTPDGAIPELGRRNPEVPPAIEGLYRRALNQNPNARFKSAGEFMGELSALAKKGAPPPLAPSRPEPASGIAPPPRPRTQSGMLQLSPRREKPPPPIPDLPSGPPPPPIETGELELPETVREDGKDRVPTAIINSEEFVTEDPDQVETKAMVATVLPPPPELPPPPPPESVAALPPVTLGPPPSTFAKPQKSNNTWLLVGLLIFAGVGVGAGGGWWLIQRNKVTPQPPPVVAVPTPLPTADEIEREAERRAAELKAAKDAEEKLAAQKAADEKAAADKAAAEKAEAERLAAEAKKPQTKKEKADALRAAMTAAAEKAAEEKKAQAEEKRLAAEKAAEEKKAALEEKRLAAEKAAAEKKAATPEKAAAPTAAASGTCPEGMRAVAAGAFKMGTASGDPMMSFDEKQLASVEVAAFCIDVYEYPNRKGASPTASIPYADAKRLCDAQGKRLCGEAEWEKACKGTGGAKWPYGGTFNPDTCNTEDDIGDPRNVAKAGAFSKCRSVYGVADLSGNVAEWTEEKIIKGGSFASGDYAVRCSARKNGASFSRSSEVGFRCCADLH